MSLQQEREQIGETNGEFRIKQEQLLDSAREPIVKVSMWGFVTSTVTTFKAPVGALGGLEVLHQIGAAAVDLRKHELNKRKHQNKLDISTSST